MPAGCVEFAGSRFSPEDVILRILSEAVDRSVRKARELGFGTEIDEVSRQKLQKMALMDVSAIPPQPEVTRDKLAKAPVMDTTVVHPAPEVMRDKLAKNAIRLI